MMLMKSSYTMSGKVQVASRVFHQKTARSVVERGSNFRFHKTRLAKSRATTLTEDTHDGHTEGEDLKFVGLHHVGILCKDLDASMKFYCDMLGLPENSVRPRIKCDYRSRWLWIGKEMIYLLELPNPDPTTGRPEHGGRDRHICVGIEDIDLLVEQLELYKIEYTMSKSGRRAVFFRDPDANCIEAFECKTWHKPTN